MSFENIIGQEKAVEILKLQLAARRIAHSYVFVGPEGVGRKKTALELARALNCTGGSVPCGKCVSCGKIDRMIHPDVHLIDFEWQSKVLDEEPAKSGKNVIKIDSVRALQKEINLKLYEGRCRVFIIDPAQTLNKEAANCLLKTLEEPAPNSLIILITDTLESLPETVISRCQQIRFRRLKEEFISGYLRREYNIGEEKALSISRMSGGSLGKAIVFKDLYEEPFGIGTAAELWNRMKDGKVDVPELVDLGNKVSRNRENTEMFVSYLLSLARLDLTANIDESSRKAIELLVSARNSLRYQINLNMLVNFTFLRLKEIMSCQ